MAADVQGSTELAIREGLIHVFVFVMAVRIISQPGYPALFNQIQNLDQIDMNLLLGRYSFGVLMPGKNGGASEYHGLCHRLSGTTRNVPYNMSIPQHQIGKDALIMNNGTSAKATLWLKESGSWPVAGWFHARDFEEVSN